MIVDVHTHCLQPEHFAEAARRADERRRTPAVASPRYRPTGKLQVGDSSKLSEGEKAFQGDLDGIGLAAVLQALRELGRELVVAAFTHDRLDDHGDNGGALLGAPLLDLGATVGKRGEVLLPVVLGVFGERVPVARRLRGRPIEGREVDLVGRVRARR